jgi:hypothetical protein
LRKRLKASRTSAGVHGLIALIYFFVARAGPGLVAGFFADFSRPWPAAGRLRDFLARCGGAGFDFVSGLRVIFAMVGVY